MNDITQDEPLAHQLEFPSLNLDLPYDSTHPPDLLIFVAHPFARSKSIDPVSKLYQVMQSTRSSPAVGIFYFFGLMSYWNLKEGVRYKIPKDYRSHNPNLWLMILASSGSSKSQQVALLNTLLPNSELHPSFSQPASPASLIEQFNQSSTQFWVEDEAAKYLRRIENPADPLAPIKGSLLKVKGSEPITYHTKSGGAVNIDHPKMSAVWINTIEGMTNTISQESMVDGFFSRIGLVLSEKTQVLERTIEQNHPNHLQDLTCIEESGLRADLAKLFEQDIKGKEYTFEGEGVVDTFERGATTLKGNFGWMLGEHNQFQPFFNRTIMESFKYAVFHHQMQGKEGTEIDTYDMEFGLRVAKFHLCSIGRFVAIKQGLIKTEAHQAQRGRPKATLDERVSAFVAKHPQASLRTIIRGVSKPKRDVLASLERLGLLKSILER